MVPAYLLPSVIDTIPAVRWAWRKSLERRMEVVIGDPKGVDGKPEEATFAFAIDAPYLRDFTPFVSARFVLKLINHRTDRKERVMGVRLALKRRHFVLWRRMLLHVPVQRTEPNTLNGTPLEDIPLRRLAPPSGSANPTTPASAVLRTVPSVPSADAAGSHVPAAPTHPLARRRWSAYADDSGRSAFPLGPPSFAPEGVPRPDGAAISHKDASVAFRSIEAAQVLLRARRRP